MSGDDNPFHSGDRTVIRPAADSMPLRRPVAESISPRADATVIAGAPPVADEGALRTVISTQPAADWTRVEPAVPSALAPATNYPGGNPILSAAAPLLLLLGGQGNAQQLLNEACANAIHEAERRMKNAGIATDERRAALLVLCEAADDIASARPGIDRVVWRQRSMTQRFFQRPPSGTAFFEKLNGLFSDSLGRHDLLQLMHACLALGFQGQYRGAPAGAAGLKQVRDDLYATLRHLRPRPPRAETLHTAPIGRVLPLWAIAAALAVVVAGGSGFMRYMIDREGDALAAALTELSPPGVVTIERASRETPQ